MYINPHYYRAMGESDAPALLAEVKRLRSQNDALRDSLRRFDGMADDAYLSGHPEFVRMCEQARAALASTVAE